MPSGWLDAKLVPLAKSIGDNRLCFHGEPGRACSTCRRNTEMCAHGSFRWACRSCNARTMPERLSACSDWTRNTLPRYDWTTAPWIERRRNNFATNTAVSANSVATNSASASYRWTDRDCGCSRLSVGLDRLNVAGRATQYR